MKLRAPFLSTAFLFVLLFARHSQADPLIYASASPPDQLGGALHFNATDFIGVKFAVDTPVVTSAIGGHFSQVSPGPVFGAVVALSGFNDFPDSPDCPRPMCWEQRCSR